MTAPGGSPAVSAVAALRALVISLVVAVPLVFDPRIGHAGARPKYLVLVLGGLAASILLATQAVATGRLPWPRPARPFCWAVAAFAGWAVCSTALSQHRPAALAGFPGTYEGLWTVLALAGMALAAATLTVADVRRVVSVLWFGTAAVVLAFALAQLLDRLLARDTGWDWARPASVPRTIGSTFGNPNHLASFLAVVLPLGLVLAVLGDHRARLASVALVAALVAGLATTVSRGALAAALAGVAMLVLLFRRDLAPHRSPAIAAVAGTAVAAVLLTVLLGAAGATKISPGALGRVGPGSTADLRLELWSTAWRVAADHPLAGVGPDVYPVVFPAYESDRFILVFGAFTVANGAHNLFLNTLANLGVVGLLALLAVLGLSARGALRTWRAPEAGGVGPEARQRRLLLGGLVAAVVAYLVQATFNNQELSLSLCFWTLLGLAAALTGAMTAAKEEA